MTGRHKWPPPSLHRKYWDPSKAPSVEDQRAAAVWAEILACFAERLSVTFDWSVVEDRGYAILRSRRWTPRQVSVKAYNRHRAVIIRLDDPQGAAYSIRKAREALVRERLEAEELDTGSNPE